MPERVMVVSGAFATHTTKLYNYYVCPESWDLKEVEYLAVNYIDELKYLGKIIGGPLQCHFGEDENFVGVNQVDNSIKVDLNEFRCKLKKGDFQLVLLDPIIGGCNHRNLLHRRHGPFVNVIPGRIYFENLAEFFEAHQSLNH
ncbi:MAG: hypothetical protein RLZ10_400 [Bacteroidota bacterium]|jgi:hypothetical protein